MVEEKNKEEKEENEDLSPEKAEQGRQTSEDFEYVNLKEEDEIFR